MKKSDQIENIDRLGLKIDGVYIGEHKDDRKKGWKSYFILFNNGVCCFMLNTPYNAEFIVDYLEQNKELSNNSPMGWGFFRIHGDTLNTETWWVMDCTRAYSRITLSGKIVDGETISIDKSWGFFENETVFHFHPLKNKPDSTNRFIK